MKRYRLEWFSNTFDKWEFDNEWFLFRRSAFREMTRRVLSKDFMPAWRVVYPDGRTEVMMKRIEDR